MHLIFPFAIKAYKLEDTHFELIRRVEGLLTILADKNELNIGHIDALWGASQNQADAQVGSLVGA